MINIIITNIGNVNTKLINYYISGITAWHDNNNWIFINFQ